MACMVSLKGHVHKLSCSSASKKSRHLPKSINLSGYHLPTQPVFVCVLLGEVALKNPSRWVLGPGGGSESCHGFHLTASLFGWHLLLGTEWIDRNSWGISKSSKENFRC